MKRAVSLMIWAAVVGLGIWAYLILAWRRAEPINSATIIAAALCTYAIGYRFYSKWIAARVLALNDRRATPCEVHEDGKDFVRTNKWIVFGHHFAAISGPGPLVGPVLAAQFGYLPGTLWILIGVVLGGAVQDLVILFASMRRDGRSLAQMVKEELNSWAGGIGLIAILSIMIILLAVLALVVVNALAESPWGVFTVGATIPIAMVMGGYLRFWRVGKVLEVSVIGIVGLLFAVWGGQFVHSDPIWSERLRFPAEPLAWTVIGYGFAASVLPVWLLLAPRDYLSTFMKLGTIVALALGTLLVLPELKMPAVSRFVDGSGLVVPGSVFPFCFITIACGAISGFHSLISSGITPKIITREGHARSIGYGAMLLESLVAIMAMIAACTLDPGVYLAMNVKGAGADAAAIEADTQKRIEASGFTWLRPDPAVPGRFVEQPVALSTGQMHELAEQMGERTLFGRTGGAATLAVGMANIFSQLTHGRWLDLWYHFALMFEALFILTTLDAGTRVGRYLIQDAIRHVAPRWGDLTSVRANVLASFLIVAAWGWFLIKGVRDPEGGIRALWPIFGIANQLLASIALCLATTILLKMHLKGGQPANPNSAAGRSTLGPGIALVTLVPLAWLLTVTVSASIQKIFHESPRIGFLAGAKAAESARPALELKRDQARQSGDERAIAVAEKALAANAVSRGNNRIDAVVTGFFLVLVAGVVALSVREWLALLRRQKKPVLLETEPVWLPDYAVREAGGPPGGMMGVVTLGLTLLKELTDEAGYERAKARHQLCQCATSAVSIIEVAAGDHLPADQPMIEPADSSSVSAAPNPPTGPTDDGVAWKATLSERYRSIRRCC
ncbi:MAG: carbon starvation protein A [Verrucomicrobiales bacterium]|nr:carbon starvation protein A [Verrucomicrobiales bacterium]